MTDCKNIVIKTVNLTKIFKDFWGRPRVKALNGLNLEIHQGEVFGLLGPNGSGKSTTLKLLLGLLFQTTGKISVLGKPVSNVSIKEKIGFLPEESYLYGYLNAKETLKFYGNLFNLPAKTLKQRSAQLLEMVGLTKNANRPVKEFSKGMARRLGLAQALINDPDIVFLDEPTSGLDPLGTKQIKDLVLDLKQRGKTVLLCSHLLADVEDVCDRIAILYGGKVRIQGKVEDLLQKHDTLQINLPDLKENTVLEIKKLISKHENNPEIKIEHPTDRLEKFFLKIINQAATDKEETSGAEPVTTPPQPDKPENNVNKSVLKQLFKQ